MVIGKSFLNTPFDCSVTLKCPKIPRLIVTVVISIRWLTLIVCLICSTSNNLILGNQVIEATHFGQKKNNSSKTSTQPPLNSSRMKMILPIHYFFTRKKIADNKLKWTLYRYVVFNNGES